MRGAVIAVLLSLGAAWAVSGDDAQVHSKRPIPVKIVGLEQGRVWAHTVYPPLMSFEVRAGKPPENGTVQLCEVVTNKKQVQEHVFNTISLRCEEGLVMELEGIDLAGGGQ